MYSTFHFNSAQELNLDILEAIKVAFQSRPITITIEEGIDMEGINPAQKAILSDRLAEDEETYLTAEESIKQLNQKYGI